MMKQYSDSTAQYAYFNSLAKRLAFVELFGGSELVIKAVCFSWRCKLFPADENSFADEIGLWAARVPAASTTPTR